MRAKDEMEPILSMRATTTMEPMVWMRVGIEMKPMTGMRAEAGLKPVFSYASQKENETRACRASRGVEKKPITQMRASAETQNPNLKPKTFFVSLRGFFYA